MIKNDINMYNNGKIYTIRCRTDNNLIYVGSTIQPLHKRWHQHKERFLYNKYKTSLLYIKMKEHGLENFYIELYEYYRCNTKEELNMKEGEIIRKIGNLNIVVPFRTTKEYYMDNIEKKKEYEKQYMNIPENRAKRNEYQKEYKRNTYDQNKEKILEQRKETVTCECGGCYRKNEAARHRKSVMHKYFEEHNEQKPIIGRQGSRELQKEKITCECGSVCGRGDFSKHRKTKKHLDYLENNNLNNNNESNSTHSSL